MGMNGNGRRMIEDYLPLETLNAIAAKEMKHPRHPVALIHYWPARRPNTACRAAIYAALVDAEHGHEAREAASQFVERLAAYKVDSATIREARKRIEAVRGARPRVLDMFAGRGTIPLEAARLGCDAHALEYNPVAYLIEHCVAVFPQKFGAGLADDLKSHGEQILARVRDRISFLYPALQTSKSSGTDARKQLDLGLAASGQPASTDPVAFIWARTVPCRRPGCDAQVPLVRQAWLRKAGGAIASVPTWDAAASCLRWEIHTGGVADAQTGAGEAVCLACSTTVPAEYVRQCGCEGRLGEVLAAVVAQGERGKVYVPPALYDMPDSAVLVQRAEKVAAEAGISLPAEPFQGEFQNLPKYGFVRYKDLFNERQLLVLCCLVDEITRVKKELLASSTPRDRAAAIATYLSMVFGRFVNFYMRFCRWQGQDQKTIAAIGDRQSMKMTYDYSEINPFADTAGCLPFALENEVACIRELSRVDVPATVVRGSADGLPYPDASFDAVVTDPPYYGSVFYADASAIFYVWHRRLVGDLYPEHFALELPPKRKEAVAQPEAHDGDAARAATFYESIMAASFAEARRVLKPGCPFICVYAHKTTEGWATLINALVKAGLTVTEAWPVQTEARGRVRALGSAALSDSIFFVARRRESDATGHYESDVRPALERIARERIATLWDDGRGIGGADLLMAAVGAGLRPYTQFPKVEYANGEEVSAARYLHEVEGAVLDTMLEQVFGLARTGVSAVDRLTRFYVLWRFTYRESAIEAGDAIVFCYPQGIELDGPDGVTGAEPHLVEKARATYRVRSFAERGSNEDLGLPKDGVEAPLIDILHRTLWLVENRPAGLAAFFRDAQPNLEQLRLIAQSLCGPVLKKADEGDALTAELGALSKLTANWRSIVDGSTVAQEIDDKTTGQRRLSLGRTKSR
jgi:putative DNA methylase